MEKQEPLNQNPVPPFGLVGIYDNGFHAKLTSFDGIFELDCPESVQEFTAASEVFDFATLQPQEAVALYLEGGHALFVTRGSNQAMYIDFYDGKRNQLLFENRLCTFLSACVDAGEWGRVWEAEKSRAKKGCYMRGQFVSERITSKISKRATRLFGPVHSCSDVVVVDDPAEWINDPPTI